MNAARSFHFDVAPYSVSLSAITNSRSCKDKGLIVSGVEVQWGVCVGLRGGLPSSVFLSEIFEWDQTVIRSKLTQKHTHARTGTQRVAHMHVHSHRHTRARTHARGTLSVLAVRRLQGGVGSGKWSSACEWGHTKGSE